VSSREKSIFVKPEEWFGEKNDAVRRVVMEDARRDARKHLA